MPQHLSQKNDLLKLQTIAVLKLLDDGRKTEGFDFIRQEKRHRVVPFKYITGKVLLLFALV